MVNDSFIVRIKVVIRMISIVSCSWSMSCHVILIAWITQFLLTRCPAPRPWWPSWWRRVWTSRWQLPTWRKSNPFPLRTSEVWLLSWTPLCPRSWKASTRPRGPGLNSPTRSTATVSQKLVMCGVQWTNPPSPPLPTSLPPFLPSSLLPDRQLAPTEFTKGDLLSYLRHHGE